MYIVYLFPAVCQEFELDKQMAEFVSKFLESPEGRTKDVVPNLYTLIGYLVCLPRSVTASIFSDKGEFQGCIINLQHQWK